MWASGEMGPESGASMSSPVGEEDADNSGGEELQRLVIARRSAWEAGEEEDYSSFLPTAQEGCGGGGSTQLWGGLWWEMTPDRRRLSCGAFARDWLLL